MPSTKRLVKEMQYGLSSFGRTAGNKDFQQTADHHPRESVRGGGVQRLRALHVDRQRHVLQPLDVEDEDVTIDILRYLINEGYEGEDLIAQYKAMKKKVVSVKDKLDEAERDIAEGRVGSAREMQNRMREKYGLYGQ